VAPPRRRGRVVARPDVLASLAARIPRPGRPALAARGVPNDPDHPDQRRYLDAQVIYQETCGRYERADVVVDNSDPDAPVIG